MPGKLPMLGILDMFNIQHDKICHLHQLIDLLLCHFLPGTFLFFRRLCSFFFSGEHHPGGIKARMDAALFCFGKKFRQEFYLEHGFSARRRNPSCFIERTVPFQTSYDLIR